MKSIGKFYPEKKMEIKEIVLKAKRDDFQGLAVPLTYNLKANFPSSYLEYSGFSLLDLKKELEKEQLELGLIAPFFYAPEVWENNPEKRAKIHGCNWPSSSWYKPLCPIYPGLFEERLAILEEAVDEINPDFIGLDFFRFPLFWEKLDEKMILQTCNCQSCSSLKDRTDIICQMAKEVKAKLTDLPITIHLVPFIDSKTIKVTGQDPELLASVVDSLSPMVYNNLLKKEPNFVIHTLKKLKNYNVWPSLEITWKGNLLLKDVTSKYDRALYFHWQG